MRLLKFRIPALILFAAAAQLARPQADFHKIKTEYQSVTAELQKHVEADWIREDNPEVIPLLTRQWDLAGDWVAAWLQAHDPASADDVKAALANLDEEERPQVLKLDETAFLVVSPGGYGNVFIVARDGSRYRVSWSTAHRQEPAASNDPKQDDLIAAWLLRPKKEDDWTSAGPLWPAIGKLPAEGLFFIDAKYSQPAGGTGLAQVTFWRWDGVTAHPLLAQAYGLTFDQKVGTRIENGFLKVQEKREYLSFFACGACEGRQVDINFRITDHGIEAAGETVVSPELDFIDDFYARLLHGGDATDIASKSAIEFARCALDTDIDTETPSVGMMGTWSIKKEGGKEIVCFSADEAGDNLFTLRPLKNSFFIEAIEPSHESCKPEEKPQIPAYQE